MICNYRIVATSMIICVCMARFSSAGSPVALRINTKHGLDNAKGAVIDAGLNLPSEISVTSSSQYDGRPFLTPDKFISDAQSNGATIISSSFSGWSFLFDSSLYQKMTDNGMVHVYAYVPKDPQPRFVPPPASFVTVNMIGGETGGGIEFGVPTNYMHGKGGSHTPSGVTSQLAGLMACLKYQHPSWNWFDIKAALRATASNYASGYDSYNYGFGSIDYFAANALSDAGKLPLFAPATIVRRQSGNQLVFYINAFRQSRRFTEVLFRFASRPAPQLRELTLSDITAMGGNYLVSSYLRSSSNTIAYWVTDDDMPYYVWFTKDLQGKFSRIEPYSVIGPIRFGVKRK